MGYETTRKIVLRDYAALTATYVLAGDNTYSDTGNTGDTNNDFTSTGANLDGEWYARSFVAANGGFVGQATNCVFGKTGAPAGYLCAAIYSNSGGRPDAQIGGDSEKILATSLSDAADGAVVTFRFSYNCPELVAETTYHVVFKTTGYTYTNGVTEIRWRTDANGAVGMDECSKYDANAATKWTTVGADVGADVTVIIPRVVPITKADFLNFYIYYIKGSSTSARILVEFAQDLGYWYVPTQGTFAAGVNTCNQAENDFPDQHGNRIHFSELSDNYARVSIKATGTITNSAAAIDAIVNRS